MPSLNRRVENLEAQVIEQAEADWNAVLDWMASWAIGHIAPERIEELSVDNWFTSDEQAAMLADMPLDLQLKADRAWPIIRA